VTESRQTTRALPLALAILVAAGGMAGLLARMSFLHRSEGRGRPADPADRDTERSSGKERG